MSRFLGDYKIYTKDEIYFKCPMCKRADGAKKLAICFNPSAKNEKNESVYLSWKCWNDIKHRGRSLNKLLSMMGHGSDVQSQLNEILGKKHLTYGLDSLNKMLFVEPKPTTQQIVLPQEFIPMYPHKDGFYYQKAYNYLINERGLTNEDLIKYNIGYCSSGTYAGFVIIPSYNSNGVLNYYVIRNFGGGNIRYKNPPTSKNIIFNELHINFSEPIYLVEGFFDATAIKRNSIPILGNSIQSELKKRIIMERPKTYIILDKDALKESMKSIQDFVQNGIEVYFVDLPNIGGIAKDPNDIGFTEIQNLIKNKSIKMDIKTIMEYRMRYKL